MKTNIHSILHLRRHLIRIIVLQASRTLRRSRDNLAILVNINSVGSNVEVLLASNAAENSLASRLHHLQLPALTAHFFKMLKVAFRDGSDVAAAENAHFEPLGFRQAVFLREFGARRLEVIEGLVDDGVCADVLGYGFVVAVVGDQLLRGSEVDAVDVSIAVSWMLVDL